MTQHIQVTEFSQKPHPGMDVVRRELPHVELAPFHAQLVEMYLEQLWITQPLPPSLACRSVRLRR